MTPRYHRRFAKSDAQRARATVRYNHLPPIYFLHIPRTGGTSVRYWLRGLFGEQEWLDAHRYSDLLSLNEDALHTHDLFSGHFGHEFADEIRMQRPDVAVVSWLRDPAERQISAFRFAAARRKAETNAAPIDPIAVLNSPGYSTHGANYQVRHLTRIWRIGEDGVTVEPVKRILTADDLELAKQHLMALDTFGITEDMERSIALFCDHFRIPLLPAPTRLNTTKERDGDPRLEGARELIAGRNELDYELYNYARQLLAERYETMLARYGIAALSAEQQFAALRKHLLKRFLETEPSDAFRADGTIDMSAGLFAEGLGPRFYRRFYGRWMRWAGESLDCVLHLPLGRGGSIDVAVEIIVARSGRILNELAFSVDRVSLPTSVDFRLDHVRARATIPGELRRSGYLPVRIRVPEVAKPAGGRSSRSFCLSGIRIEPSREERRHTRPIPVISTLGRLRAATEATIMAARDNFDNYVR